MVRAHRKLSDYYMKFDQSPFYIWSSSGFPALIFCNQRLTHLACPVLDPRISLDGLLEDCNNDPASLAHIDEMKDKLKVYFERHYNRPDPAQLLNFPQTTASESGSPQKVDFTARYHRATRVIDELAEYLRQPRENFKTCNPLKWWAARTSQFPNLSRFARDLLTIPGSAVAVERIFSGGRDTISIRRSRLTADTIRILMLVKHHLRLKREAAIAKLQNLTSH
jgi:hypothetical protein